MKMQSLDSPMITIDDDDVMIIDSFDCAIKPKRDYVEEWSNEIRNKFYRHMINENEKFLDELMVDYVLSLKTKAIHFRDRVSLRKKILSHIQFFHLHYLDVRFTESLKYVDNMEDILCIYCNLEMEIIRRLKRSLCNKKNDTKEDSKSVCWRMTYVLNTYLFSKEEYILNVLIKMNKIPNIPTCKKIMNVLYTNFLLRFPPSDLTDEAFCRSYIVYQKWKEICDVSKHDSMEKALCYRYKQKKDPIENNKILKSLLAPRNYDTLDVLSQIGDPTSYLTKAYLSFKKAQKAIEEEPIINCTNALDDDVVEIEEENDFSKSLKEAYIQECSVTFVLEETGTNNKNTKKTNKSSDVTNCVEISDDSDEDIILSGIILNDTEHRKRTRSRRIYKDPDPDPPVITSFLDSIPGGNVSTTTTEVPVQETVSNECESISEKTFEKVTVSVAVDTKETSCKQSDLVQVDSVVCNKEVSPYIVLNSEVKTDAISKKVESKTVKSVEIQTDQLEQQDDRYRYCYGIVTPPSDHHPNENHGGQDCIYANIASVESQTPDNIGSDMTDDYPDTPNEHKSFEENEEPTTVSLAANTCGLISETADEQENVSNTNECVDEDTLVEENDFEHNQMGTSTPLHESHNDSDATLEAMDGEYAEVKESHVIETPKDNENLLSDKISSMEICDGVEGTIIEEKCDDEIIYTELQTATEALETGEEVVYSSSKKNILETALDMAQVTGEYTHSDDTNEEIINNVVHEIKIGNDDQLVFDNSGLCQSWYIVDGKIIMPSDDEDRTEVAAVNETLHEQEVTVINNEIPVVDSTSNPVAAKQYDKENINGKILATVKVNEVKGIKQTNSDNKNKVSLSKKSDNSVVMYASMPLKTVPLKTFMEFEETMNSSNDIEDFNNFLSSPITRINDIADNHEFFNTGTSTFKLSPEAVKPQKLAVNTSYNCIKPNKPIIFNAQNNLNDVKPRLPVKPSIVTDKNRLQKNHSNKTNKRKKAETGDNSVKTKRIYFDPLVSEFHYPTQIEIKESYIRLPKYTAEELLAIYNKKKKEKKMKQRRLLINELKRKPEIQSHILQRVFYKDDENEKVFKSPTEMNSSGTVQSPINITDSGMVDFTLYPSNTNANSQYYNNFQIGFKSNSCIYSNCDKGFSCNTPEVSNALNLTIPSKEKVPVPENEFSNSPKFLQDSDQLVQHCLRESATPEVSHGMSQSTSFLSNNSNFYQFSNLLPKTSKNNIVDHVTISIPTSIPTLNNAAEPFVPVTTPTFIPVSKAPSVYKSNLVSNTQPEINPTPLMSYSKESQLTSTTCRVKPPDISPSHYNYDNTILLPTPVPNLDCADIKYKVNKLHKEIELLTSETENMTPMPFKKRIKQVPQEPKIYNPKKEEISYPATPMISIAELEALRDSSKYSNRTFKTPAERKEMPPLPVFYDQNLEPTPIIADQFNINNLTYNNPTIHYYVNNDPCCRNAIPRVFNINNLPTSDDKNVS